MCADCKGRIAKCDADAEVVVWQTIECRQPNELRPDRAAPIENINAALSLVGPDVKKSIADRQYVAPNRNAFAKPALRAAAGRFADGNLLLLRPNGSGA